MRRTHPHLERAEGMLSRLAAQAHRLWVLIETLLPTEDVYRCPAGQKLRRACQDLGAVEVAAISDEPALPARRLWQVVTDPSRYSLPRA